jgi:hypothetical protein
MRYPTTFIFLLLVTLIASCGKSPALTGKWEYEKMESSGDSLVMDSLLNEANENNKGMVLSFNEDLSFSVEDKQGVETDKGTYILSDDRKFINLNDHAGTVPRVQVVGLTRTHLRINLVPSSEEYLVFKKIK